MYTATVFPWAHQSPRLKRHLDRFSRLCMAHLFSDRPTDRPTDHATRSVTTGGAHSGEAKFCYCLRLQQVFIGAADSTDKLQQSAVIFSCNTRWVAVLLQYSLEESVSHRRTRQVTQLFTYLLTHKLFSSCIRRYLVSRNCD